MQTALRGSVLEDGETDLVVHGGREVMDLFVSRRRRDGIGKSPGFVLGDRTVIVSPRTAAGDGILEVGSVRPCAEVLAPGGGVRIAELPRSHPEADGAPARTGPDVFLGKIIGAEPPGGPPGRPP